MKANAPDGSFGFVRQWSWTLWLTKSVNVGFCLHFANSPTVMALSASPSWCHLDRSPLILRDSYLHWPASFSIHYLLTSYSFAIKMCFLCKVVLLITMKMFTINIEFWSMVIWNRWRAWEECHHIYTNVRCGNVIGFIQWVTGSFCSSSGVSYLPFAINH